MHIFSIRSFICYLCSGLIFTAIKIVMRKRWNSLDLGDDPKTIHTVNEMPI